MDNINKFTTENAEEHREKIEKIPTCFSVLSVVKYFQPESTQRNTEKKEKTSVFLRALRGKILSTREHTEEHREKRKNLRVSPCPPW